MSAFAENTSITSDELRSLDADRISSTPNPDYSVNNKPYILLIGNAGVGKTSYIRKAANQGFSETYIPTTGYVETYIPGLYNFIELSGQECHNEYAEEVLARADRIYIIAAKNSKKSLENIPFWINKYSHLHINFTIIINKCDLDSTSTIRSNSREHSSSGFDLDTVLHEVIRQTGEHMDIRYISCKHPSHIVIRS